MGGGFHGDIFDTTQKARSMKKKIKPYNRRKYYQSIYQIKG